MAKKEIAKYKRTIFLGIMLIALGVTFNTTLEIGSLGTVFIALGGLFFCGYGEETEGGRKFRKQRKLNCVENEI